MIIKEACTAGSGIDCQKIDCSEQAFLLRRIPILQSVHERLTQGLQKMFSALIKTPCLVTPKNPQSRFIDGYFKQMPASVCMNTFCVGPMNAQVLMLLDERLIYHMVDRAFGGTGKAPSKTERCALTRTELAWTQSLLSEVSKQLQSAFQSAVPLHFTLEASQVNPISAQAYPPKMLVAVCPLELTIESQIVGQLTFLWPYEWLIDMQDIRKKEMPKNFKNNLHKSLEDVKVAVKAVRGNKKITLSELSNWKVGDLIAVNLDEHSTLAVESTPLFRVELGNIDDKYALKIVDKI